MKKVFTISALVAASFGFAMNTNAEVITWDFSEYTEQVDLGGDSYTTEYNGLTLVGNQGADSGKEYVCLVLTATWWLHSVRTTLRLPIV